MCLFTIMLKCFFSRLALQFISLILFMYQKHTLIVVLLLVIAIWKFLGKPQFVQTTILTLKEWVFVFITRAFCLREFWMSNIWKKVYVQRNPFLVIAVGDFNMQSQDKTNFEGDAIENLTSQFVLYQVIKEPAHILDTSSSCINLIFTSQPNLITESGVHSSLHSNCHHQIIFAKFNFKVVYPSP